MEDTVLFFDTQGVEISQDGRGFVKLKLEDGTEIGRIRLQRLFPITEGNSYIRMVRPDGHEYGIIKSLGELKPESRESALNALNHFYIIPVITEIISLYDAHGSLFWEVKTDKGIRKFVVANRYRDVSILPSGKMVIRDTDDNQYEITDYNNFPEKSRKLLEPWL